MIRLGQQLVNGVSIGSIYALIAVGYSLIYSILRFSNFAHSSFLIVGAYSGFFLVMAVNAPFPLALLGAIVTSGAMAFLTEKAAYNPIRERGSPTLYFIIASMGVAIFFENLIISTVGPKFRSYPVLFKIASVKIGGINVSTLDVLIAGLGMFFVLLLNAAIERTRIGTATRAASWDLEAVSLMGLSTSALVGAVFFAAGMMAGLAGVFLGVKYTVYPQLGGLTLKAYVGAIFGGLGSMRGAVIGSITLGLLETLVAAYISSQLRDLFVFFLLVVVLLVRPGGLVGEPMEDKV